MGLSGDDWRTSGCQAGWVGGICGEVVARPFEVDLLDDLGWPGIRYGTVCGGRYEEAHSPRRNGWLGCVCSQVPCLLVSSTSW